MSRQAFSSRLPGFAAIRFARSPSWKVLAVSMMLFIEPANMSVGFVNHSMQQLNGLSERRLALTCASRQQLQPTSLLLISNVIGRLQGLANPLYPVQHV